jgi:hypothetical protein
LFYECRTILFETPYGAHLFAFLMINLMPGRWVNAETVNAWAAVLNHTEKKQEGKPKRLFLYTTAIVSQLLQLAICLYICVMFVNLLL